MTGAILSPRFLLAGSWSMAHGPPIPLTAVLIGLENNEFQAISEAGHWGHSTLLTMPRIRIVSPTSHNVEWGIAGVI